MRCFYFIEIELQLGYYDVKKKKKSTMSIGLSQLHWALLDLSDSLRIHRSPDLLHLRFLIYWMTYFLTLQWLVSTLLLHDLLLTPQESYKILFLFISLYRTDRNILYSSWFFPYVTPTIVSSAFVTQHLCLPHFQQLLVHYNFIGRIAVIQILFFWLCWKWHCKIM